MPEKAAYRINTEQIVCYRLSVVENFEGKEEIENNICCGKAEMLLSQAKDEYKLACKMIIWKPWESLTQFAPPGQWKWP
ncbi:hypothetical protein RUM44_005515 [Polyplax serrata]|uniref:Uncharacterized protein n=1 Tax=Polyplax serrata TaxID=468196 RepID=A0ABR1ADL7_POLSC